MSIMFPSVCRLRRAWMMMGVTSTRSTNLNSSTKIKLMLSVAAILLQLQVCFCADATETDQRNLNTVEIAETVGNNFDTPPDVAFFRSPGPFGNEEDDIINLKRHLGAVAAMSGSRQFTGSKSYIPPSKKHLGSIAAVQSTGWLGGRKLELHAPSSERDKFKRHLGSLMALSGDKPRPLTRSLKGSLPDYQMDFSAPDILDSQFERNSDFGVIPEEILPSIRDSLIYSNDASLHQDMDTVDVEGRGDADEYTLKSKRFLGALARGGWFPRHFRGESPFGKRHIGSLARLGWMPNAKGSTRLGLMGEQGAEIGLKRNDLATRRRMLYHFTAPSLWTSPRGK